MIDFDSARDSGKGVGSRILICAMGLAPQVVTETLYALHHRLNPPFHPDRLILLSTTSGFDIARRRLLLDKEGALDRFRTDWPEARVPTPELLVLEGMHGALPDIRTSDEAAMAADQVTDLVRRLTASEMTSLHVSVAGGRKTIGALLAAAMSLYGRRQDELSHVLVSPPYESRSDFFYPLPGDRDADRALTLARIPFLRLRDYLPEHLLSLPLIFEDLVRRAQQALAEPLLEIDLRGDRMHAAGQPLCLPASEAALYIWLAMRRRRNEPPLTARNANIEEFIELYERIAESRDQAHHLERVVRSLRDGLESSYLAEKKCRINRALRLQLGPRALPFLIISTGKRPQTAMDLALPASHIHLRN